MEIEVKCRLANPHAFRASLAGKVQYVQTVRQHDYLLDYADGRLIKRDEVLRVREERVLHGLHWGQRRMLVTFKGRKQRSSLAKKREEHEMELLAEAQDVFAEARKLGLKVKLDYEKIREEYLAPWAKVEIDNLPRYRQLGTFVEIEAPNERRVLDVMRLLNLEEQSVEPKSYPQLVREARGERPKRKAGRKGKAAKKRRRHG